MENILDILDKWGYDYMVTAGLIILVGAFILSFSCKTFWGEWKSRK